jgi:hypothetical protein
MKPRPEHELAVQIATLLALYEWQGGTAEVVYIGVPQEGRSGKYNCFADPDDELILELYSHGINAKPFSEREKSGRFFVDSNGQPSFCLHVSPIQWIGETQANLDAIYMKGDRWGSSFRFVLHYDSVAWTVSEQNFTGIF